MEVLIGNPHPREVYGYRQTRICLPPLEYDKTFDTIVSSFEAHIEDGFGPSSVYTPVPELTDRLKDHYGISKSIFNRSVLNLRTNAGSDFQANVMGNPAANGVGTYAPAYWIGLSADSTAISVNDTILLGEITGVGTLVRAQATFGHTAGASTYTLTNIFKSDQSVLLTKDGIFNSPAGGVVLWEEVFVNSFGAISPRQMYSGDQLTITITIGF